MKQILFRLSHFILVASIAFSCVWTAIPFEDDCHHMVNTHSHLDPVPQVCAEAKSDSLTVKCAHSESKVKHSETSPGQNSEASSCLHLCCHSSVAGLINLRDVSVTAATKSPFRDFSSTLVQDETPRGIFRPPRVD